MKTYLTDDLTVLSSHRRSQTTLGTRGKSLTLLLLFTFAAAGFAADDFFGSPATQKAVAPATPAPANPTAAGVDLDAYRTQYSQSLAALRAERETKYARVRASYGAALERLQKDVTTRGDLDGAVAVKTERERIVAAQEPNADERKAMLPALAAVRTRYEQELQPIAADNARQEEALAKRYAAALQELQMRYAQRNELEKALAVKGELTALAAKGSATPAVPLGGATPKVSTPFGTAAPLGVTAAISKSHIALTNSTKAKEAEVVLAAAEARNPEIFRSTKELELISFYDFAEDPMKHHNGGADHVQGEHAKKAWVSSADGMIAYGPTEQVEPGNYFVVYRVRFYDKGATGDVCFLDVAEGGVTRSGLRPKGTEVLPGAWHEIALPLQVDSAKKYQFRLWGTGKKMAMDRVYLFKVKASR